MFVGSQSRTVLQVYPLDLLASVFFFLRCVPPLRAFRARLPSIQQSLVPSGGSRLWTSGDHRTFDGWAKGILCCTLPLSFSSIASRGRSGLDTLRQVKCAPPVVIQPLVVQLLLYLVVFHTLAGPFILFRREGMSAIMVHLLRYGDGDVGGEHSH